MRMNAEPHTSASDVYRDEAARRLDMLPEDVTDEHRRKVKRGMFPFLYGSFDSIPGMGSSTGLGKAVSEAVDNGFRKAVANRCGMLEAEVTDEQVQKAKTDWAGGMLPHYGRHGQPLSRELPHDPGICPMCAAGNKPVLRR